MWYSEGQLPSQSHPQSLLKKALDVICTRDESLIALEVPLLEAIEAATDCPSENVTQVHSLKSALSTVHSQAGQLIQTLASCYPSLSYLNNLDALFHQFTFEAFRVLVEALQKRPLPVLTLCKKLVMRSVLVHVINKTNVKVREVLHVLFYTTHHIGASMIPFIYIYIYIYIPYIPS